MLFSQAITVVKFVIAANYIELFNVQLMRLITLLHLVRIVVQFVSYAFIISNNQYSALTFRCRLAKLFV